MGASVRETIASPRSPEEKVWGEEAFSARASAIASVNSAMRRAVGDAT
jgi:hypothetical protein